MCGYGASEKENSGRGRGLFARKPIPAGDHLLEYTGIKIPTAEADHSSSRYLFDLENGWTLDGSPHSNTARYINHSCEPNCECRLEDGRIMIYALRDIKRGEELTFDYGSEYFGEYFGREGCKCGAHR